MKRVMILLAALLLMLATAAPAASAKPSQPYTVYNATCGELYGPDFQYWETGNTWHMRNYRNFHDNFFLIGGVWVAYGTNDVVAKANGHLDGPVTTMSGTFEIRGSLVGDFDGSFRWGMSASGSATGQGVNDSVGKHLKVELLAYEPSGLPAPPSGTACDGSPAWAEGYELWTVH